MRFLIYVIVAAFLFVGYVKYLQSHAVFFPTQEISFNPGNAGLAFEEVYLTTDDGFRLHAWFIPCAHARRTILFLHGNGGNIGDRIDKLFTLYNRGVNCFIVDWRGYGKSEGRPSEQGIYRDAQAAYDFLTTQKKVAWQDIIVYGESLGAAAAIDLAAGKPVGSLILEGGFSSGQDMARELYPWVPAFLIGDSYDSLGKIAGVKAPLLFLHSVSDEIVPIKLARKLFAAAAAEKYFVELEGGHNTIFFDSRDKYVEALEVFIARLP